GVGGRGRTTSPGGTACHAIADHGGFRAAMGRGRSRRGAPAGCPVQDEGGAERRLPALHRRELPRGLRALSRAGLLRAAGRARAGRGDQLRRPPAPARPEADRSLGDVEAVQRRDARRLSDVPGVGGQDANNPRRGVSTTTYVWRRLDLDGRVFVRLDQTVDGVSAAGYEI